MVVNAQKEMRFLDLYHRHPSKMWMWNLRFTYLAWTFQTYLLTSSNVKGLLSLFIWLYTLDFQINLLTHVCMLLILHSFLRWFPMIQKTLVWNQSGDKYRFYRSIPKSEVNNQINNDIYHFTFDKMRRLISNM